MKLLLRAYDLLMSRLNCCGVGVGCGCSVVALVAAGAIGGAGATVWMLT